LDAEDSLDVEVEVVEADGQKDIVVTDDGGVVEVNLESGEGAALVTNSKGKNVLILADDLTPEELIDETSNAVTEIIGEVAEENGVVVDYEGLKAAISERGRAIVSAYLQEVAVPVFKFEAVLSQQARDEREDLELERLHLNRLVETNWPG